MSITERTASARIFSPRDEDIKEEVEQQQQNEKLIQIPSDGETYTLPEQSLRRRVTMGTRSPTYTDEQNNNKADNEKDREVLTFHGIILRSQLVEMLKNKIFFDETQGVGFR